MKTSARRPPWVHVTLAGILVSPPCIALAVIWTVTYRVLPSLGYMSRPFVLLCSSFFQLDFSFSSFRSAAVDAEHSPRPRSSPSFCSAILQPTSPALLQQAVNAWTRFLKPSLPSAEERLGKCHSRWCCTRALCSP
ncbi:hypothetical protein EXIGLDRAFT_474042 [Exidia glandulosa HHB12029]|uniref:Uncharacterized protein n=1 Tax=Exidia glandulosa HHB12029 TaxID=1314781 RepID=A0A165ARN4_EXIGL|nr:hypothetical protein EXIGLDRAFT_474042 [Exidia glandulosa HHB12029]